MSYPYKVTLDRAMWPSLRDIVEWCNTNFGDGGHPSIGDTWKFETAFGYSTFSFRKSQDAAHFALMWT